MWFYLGYAPLSSLPDKSYTARYQSDNNSFTANQSAPRDRINAEKISVRYRILIIFNSKFRWKNQGILLDST